MTHELTLKDLCASVSKKSQDKYKAELKFSTNEHFYSYALLINGKVMFVSINDKSLTYPEVAIIKALAERLFNSVLEAGVSKAIEWYQRQVDYEQATNSSAVPDQTGDNLQG